MTPTGSAADYGTMQVSRAAARVGWSAQRTHVMSTRCRSLAGTEGAFARAMAPRAMPARGLEGIGDGIGVMLRHRHLVTNAPPRPRRTGSDGRREGMFAVGRWRGVAAERR